MNQVVQKLDAIRWVYSDGDPNSLLELERRIASVGRTPKDFISYAPLVDGIKFHLPNVNDGRPFEIFEWSDLHRGVIGCFLGNIAARSYRKARFFASSLVIGVTANQPGDGFWTLAREVGLLMKDSEESRLQFWFEHVRLARGWYKNNVP